jgi:hypothetical protein
VNRRFAGVVVGANAPFLPARPPLVAVMKVGSGSTAAVAGLFDLESGWRRRRGCQYARFPRVGRRQRVQNWLLGDLSFRREERLGRLACSRDPLAIIAARVQVSSAKQDWLRSVDPFAIGKGFVGQALPQARPHAPSRCRSKNRITSSYGKSESTPRARRDRNGLLERFLRFFGLTDLAEGREPVWSISPDG